MKVSIDIDGDLLKRAMRLAGTRTRKEAINLALEEFIKARLREQLKGMAGSGAVDMSFAELKKLRHQRQKL
ncbi:MAG: type II toxin-antitoxin system VapB family antitoxin [Nitrospirae bacterium]|nr:type II toxin-antitoxin system VapB family antitoxin [Nitrospirota bacterium]MCL5423284.1 type II toxin-antitoxin system VapB family antitoxin [Nitrospirota bacterium]